MVQFQTIVFLMPLRQCMVEIRIKVSLTITYKFNRAYKEKLGMHYGGRIFLGGERVGIILLRGEEGLACFVADRKDLRLDGRKNIYILYIYIK